MTFLSLPYATRSEVTVPAYGQTPLLTDLPYSTAHDSVEHELIARAFHIHGAYREDNSSVYYGLEKAARRTIYSQSLKPYQRLKDGRSALLSILAQFTDKDK